VAEIRSALTNKEPVSTEILNYDADGNSFWNQVEISPICDSEDRAECYVGFQRDVADRMMYKRKLEDQLEWLGNFGKVLSHDLETPSLCSTWEYRIRARNGRW
jgi:hypothetical protein